MRQGKFQIPNSKFQRSFKFPPSTEVEAALSGPDISSRVLSLMLGACLEFSMSRAGFARGMAVVHRSAAFLWMQNCKNSSKRAS
jgi:hypothetical protein